MKHICRILFALAIVCGWAPAAVADDDDPVLNPYVCGSLTNAYGPFDYNNPPPNAISLVEGAHYTPGIEHLNAGKMVDELGPIWGEFDYTLRALPNHPGALQAIDRLSMRLKSDKPPRAQRSAHCYYIRAIAFKPTDGMVRMLYGMYLLRRDKSKEAIVQFDKAEKYAGENANLHYNIGLAYFQVKDYPKAMEHAKKAYDMGFPLPGLRNMLEKAGKWQADSNATAETTRAAPAETVK
jgi:tetratricopeptide (TPR) repeat protein